MYLAAHRAEILAGRRSGVASNHQWKSRRGLAAAAFQVGPVNYA